MVGLALSISDIVCCVTTIGQKRVAHKLLGVSVVDAWRVY